MPSTPRMIQIEAKASQPGEPLTQAEVSEWARELVSAPAYDEQPSEELQGGVWWDFTQGYLTVEYPKAIRYLDSTGYRRPMNESL